MMNAQSETRLGRGCKVHVRDENLRRILRGGRKVLYTYAQRGRNAEAFLKGGNYG